MKMIDPRHCQTFCHGRLVDPIAGIISCGKVEPKKMPHTLARSLFPQQSQQDLQYNQNNYQKLEDQIEAPRHYMFDHFLEIPKDLEFGLDLLSSGTEMEFVGQFIELAEIRINIKRYCGLNILALKHALAAYPDYIFHEWRCGKSCPCPAHYAARACLSSLRASCPVFGN
jgi:hypothetical protein